MSSSRPPYIISTSEVPEKEGRYQGSDELLASTRPIGRVAGLMKIGLHVARLPPGRRLSWPHAEEKEEEFVYVLEGPVDAWVDGYLHRMETGDLAAFPAGTGICHTFINNGTKEATLLVGGEANKADNRIFYPQHAHRRMQMPWSHWWENVPLAPPGLHDGLPAAMRGEPDPEE